MTWSYNPDELEDNKLYQVRLKLGDTIESTALLQDEEILFLLAQSHGSVLGASIQGCISIISKLSGAVDFKVGPYSESQTSRISSYKSLLKELTTQVAQIGPPVAKSPTTAPIFHYGMMANKGGECGD